MRLTVIASLLALVFAAPPVAAQSAPNKIATVRAVMTAHPEIDRCDENTRGAIVDYSAQRLNAEIGRVVWGRKARSADGANPNTDGLTFLLPDGRFEIVDVISGTSPCGATWDNAGAFAPGQNGFWTAPKLTEPTSGGGSTPPPPPPPLTAATVELQQQQLAALTQLVLLQQQQLEALAAQNAAIVRGLADLKAAISAGVKIRF